jgi:hypothetical protein
LGAALSKRHGAADGESQDKAASQRSSEVEFAVESLPTHENAPIATLGSISARDPGARRHAFGRTGGTLWQKMAGFPARANGEGPRLLGRNPSHLAKTVIREILSLPVFDGLQNETGDELGPVAIGVLG